MQRWCSATAHHGLQIAFKTARAASQQKHIPCSVHSVLQPCMFAWVQEIKQQPLCIAQHRHSDMYCIALAYITKTSNLESSVHNYRTESIVIRIAKAHPALQQLLGGEEPCVQIGRRHTQQANCYIAHWQRMTSQSKVVGLSIMRSFCTFFGAADNCVCIAVYTRTHQSLWIHTADNTPRALIHCCRNGPC